MLKRLPFNNANATKLKSIKGQQSTLLLWEDDDIKQSPVWKKNSCMTFQFANGHPDSTSPQILESFCYASNNSLKLVDSNGCNEIKTIINGNGITQGVLKCLEHLCINNVLKLESIWQGPVYPGSLAQLKNLTLSKCPELKKIFSKGMIQQLPQLQYLRVEDCRQIEEIVMESENNGLEANVLPSLKTLILLDLPKLTSIWVDDSLEWPSLQRIKISMCNMLRRLPFNNAQCNQIEIHRRTGVMVGALMWDDDVVKQKLQSLCHPQLADPHNPFVVLLVKLTRMVAVSATGLCGGLKNF
ncbi:Disease resistance protein RPS2 [Vitis vinifera]|uniref:Disease resistance protein RPS2 n=1 Tax=Vitis vinifera TaxID=29760 RepID=A0A438C7K5_VITVI|nr:Disease resistance protein RPS2 [Vitis vinifera]